MKEEEKFRRDLEENSVSIRNEYKLMPWDKSDRFSIIKVDPILLHPGFKDKKLIDNESYELSTESDLSRGQYRFEVQCESKEELIEIFLYLTRKGYKYTKILWQSTREVKRVWYTFEELKKDIKGFAPGIHNILEVIINLKDLEKFKKDIYDLRDELNYRNDWRGEVYDFWNRDRIID